jgi:hypothetical protein
MKFLSSQLLEGQYFKKSNRTTSYISQSWKKFFLYILMIHRRTFKFEYLGEFEFILENILGYETGSQMG